MFTQADAALGGGKYPWSTARSRASARPTAPEAGRLLRGIVHLRPEAGYLRLFGINCPDGALIEGAGYLTSANVWRWVVQHGCSVSIDVELGTIRPWLRDPSGGLGEVSALDAQTSHQPGAGRDDPGSPGAETRERMLGREATHVHVVPLRAPDGAIHGMITLEARCRAAMSDDHLWEAACQPLELIAIVAAPYLAALPPRPTPQPASPDRFLPVAGPTIGRLIDLLRIFACQEETILISGPTGAGKSRMARWCHENSSRREHPFETLDLISIPEELQMAELFGWKRGAFTGAVKDSAGAIARAGQGTIFIDEIDKLSQKAQAGLLRVIEERRYRPIGDEAGERRTPVRFLIGTNAELRAAVQAGRFREDLYYRINVLPVRLPPLSERLDELPAWAEYMLGRRHTESGGEGPAQLAPEAIKILLATPWPGNLRQLDNIVRRAYALALAERGTGPLLLKGDYVLRALGYEAPAPDSSLLAQLWSAARTFVAEAERRCDSAAPLSIDSCDALRGLVLGAAVVRSGSPEKAFTLLGQQQLLKNRNHHRALRRELDKVRELLQVIGGRVDPELTALLDAKDESPEGR